MRLLALYLRSRLADRALALLLFSGVIDLLWLQHFPPDAIWRALALAVLPLLPAVVIGAGARSPFGDIEHCVSRPLGPIRLGHLLALALIAALVLLGASAIVGSGIERELVRNLAGYLGLSLLAARLLGIGISWAIPLAYATLAFVLLPQNPLAWPARYPLDARSLNIALALLVVGLLAVTLRDTRDQPDDRV
jgi:hypothetical protein